MRPRIAAARLTQQITLEQPRAPQPDGDGGYTEQYDPLLPALDYAAIDSTAPTADQRVANTAIATATHRVTLRYRGDITTKARLTFTDYSGQTHQLWVRGTENVEQASEVLILWCEEHVIAAGVAPGIAPPGLEVR